MSSSACLAHVRITDAYGRQTIKEKLVCSHCQTVFDKPGPRDPSGFCHVCFKPVCLRCGAIDKCDPFEKKLDRLEARAAMLRSMGL